MSVKKNVHLGIGVWNHQFRHEPITIWAPHRRLVWYCKSASLHCRSAFDHFSRVERFGSHALIAFETISLSKRKALVHRHSTTNLFGNSRFEHRQLSPNGTLSHSPIVKRSGRFQSSRIEIWSQCTSVQHGLLKPSPYSEKKLHQSCTTHNFNLEVNTPRLKLEGPVAHGGRELD